MTTHFSRLSTQATTFCSYRVAGTRYVLVCSLSASRGERTEKSSEEQRGDNIALSCCVQVLSFLQNFAKIVSDSFCEAESDTNLVYRAVENNISDGRKVFRFFKWWREVYKVRRGIFRYQSGRDANGTAWCIDANCGIMDTFGHFFSFHYFLLDNMLWAVNVGLLKAKATPKVVTHLISDFIQTSM